MNSSSVTVSWDSAFGDFDFHRVTVTNNSVTNTHTIPKEEQAAVVTGLVDGCSYNVSAERVRGVTAGSAAFLAVTTGRRYFLELHQSTPCYYSITCPDWHFIKLVKLPPLWHLFLLFLLFMSASPCTGSTCPECVSTCILSALGRGGRVCGSLPGQPATRPGKCYGASCTWWIHSGIHTSSMKHTLLRCSNTSEFTPFFTW